MKKILVFIITLIICCSCGPENSQSQMKSERYEYVSNTYQKHADLLELTFKDEYGEYRTHQFVSVHYSDHSSGIAHWPDCKYCKERGL